MYVGVPVSNSEYNKKKERKAQREGGNPCTRGSDRNAITMALSSKPWAVKTATELLLSNYAIESELLIYPACPFLRSINIHYL